MRQSEVLEAFKQQQHAQHALHVFFDLDTGFEILSIEEYGHLQVGTVKIRSFYITFTVQLEVVVNGNMLGLYRVK